MGGGGLIGKNIKDKFCFGCGGSSQICQASGKRASVKNLRGFASEIQPLHRQHADPGSERIGHGAKEETGGNGQDQEAGKHGEDDFVDERLPRLPPDHE